MKTLQKFKSAALAACMMTSGAMTAHAAITIETVAVGNLVNAADTLAGSSYGAVAYGYAIGKYEVTNAQYAPFLNAVAKTDPYVLYGMGTNTDRVGITRSGSSGTYTYSVKSGYENKPVSAVSFWNATRFTNWLSNGEGSGDTETGSYTLGSVANPVNSSVTRNVGAKWVVANENEWYKAAYYDPNKGGTGVGGYWLQATKSDTLGDNTAYAATNGANYFDGDYAVYKGGTTDVNLQVGSYLSASSYYGTFDQGGNVSEWTEASGSFGRMVRGGSSSNTAAGLMSSVRNETYMTSSDFAMGFRVVSLTPIPEPNVYGAAMGVVMLGVVMLRRRKSSGSR
jgi:formylglycine-generating enzyme required for sulfatase activity